jgi:hypothetical protein
MSGLGEDAGPGAWAGHPRYRVYVDKGSAWSRQGNGSTQQTQDRAALEALVRTEPP